MSSSIRAVSSLYISNANETAITNHQSWNQTLDNDCVEVISYKQSNSWPNWAIYNDVTGPLQFAMKPTNEIPTLDDWVDWVNWDIEGSLEYS